MSEQAATLRPQVCEERCGLLLDAAGDACWSCKYGVYVQFATPDGSEPALDAGSIKSSPLQGQSKSIHPDAGGLRKLANVMRARVPWKPVVYTLLLESETDDDDDTPA